MDRLAAMGFDRDHCLEVWTDSERRGERMREREGGVACFRQLSGEGGLLQAAECKRDLLEAAE